MNLKIGGIYTVEEFKYYLRAAIVIIDKNDEYSFYVLKISNYFNKNDIENILKNQIKYLELKKKNFYIGTEHFLSSKIDGYMGQVNDDMLVKLSNKFKSCS